LDGVEVLIQNYITGLTYDYTALTELVMRDENKETNKLTSVIKIPYEVKIKYNSG
jgi:hypothetical protein